MRPQTLLFTEALLPQGWARDVRIVVEHGRIASVEAGVRGDEADERHAIGVPGIPNLHSHAFQRGMAGLSETRGTRADNFWTWREVMYRFLGALEPDDVQAIAAQAYVEMLEEGFTRVGEFHYLHHDRNGLAYSNVAEIAERVVAAAETAGIGLTLLPVFYAHSDFGGRAPAEGQRRFICDLDGFARLMEASSRALSRVPGASLGLAPHSLRAVTPTELGAISRLAGDGPIHIHAAEQTKEVDDCVAWSGLRPVEWLLRHQKVDARWCLIHATHMTEAETQGLARRGAVAGLCPVTEANLGDGIFKLPVFVEAGGRYGLGTDSNIRIGLTDELRQLEYAQRLGTRSRNVASAVTRSSTGRVLLDSALAGGNQALGQASGGLAPGASADILTLHPDHPAIAAHRGDARLDGWIFAARHGIIDCVWCMGRKVVINGRHHERDAVAANFRRIMEKLAC
jgi:formimidoylglutamate deiminase